MKKLIITILASASISVFATTTTASQTATQAATKFDNTKIKCGEHTLGTQENVDSLTNMCKGFQFGKGKAGFLDENSGKKVVCQEKKGKLLLDTCQVSPKQ